MKYNEAMTRSNKSNWDKAVKQEHDPMTNQIAFVHMIATVSQQE
jgi:hypothetical protein